MRKFLPLLALAILASLPACVGGGGGPAGAGSGFAGIVLENGYWGRLVDIFDDNGISVETDVMVRQGMETDGVDYTLALNPVTQREVLTIHRSWKDNQGVVSPAFQTLYDSATSGLDSLGAKGLVSNGNYTRVARNGAVKLEFSEYLDPASVNRLTLQLYVNDRITDVRYIVKESVGIDGEPIGVILIDPTITPQDAAEYMIAENGVGFDASLNQVDGNAVVRIPTTLEPVYGQTQVLTNKAGTRSLAVMEGDPLDYSDGLNEVVIRVFRTGNSDDPANGFMKDNQRPQLQADLDADILKVVDQGSLKDITYRIRALACRAISSKVGDVLQTQNGVLLVTQVLDDSDENALVVQGSILSGTIAAGDYSSLPLDGGLTTIYHSDDYDKQWCWVRFDPLPETMPATGVDPYATVGLRFSEPVDPATVLALETMVLHSYAKDAIDAHRGYEIGSETVGSFIDRLLGYETEGNGSGRMMFGPISVSADSRDFTMAPSAGMVDAFSEGADLRIGLALRDGLGGVLDLAGNPLGLNSYVAGAPGQPVLTLDDPVPNDRYFALRFNRADENGDGFSEYKGQYIIPGDGLMVGRELIRFSRQADPSANQWIGQRAAWSQSGIATPLTPGGAVMETVYGYHHLGLGVTSPSEYNIDVEGLNWAPFNGLVLDDFFPRYSIALSHCNRYPDDYINPATGYPDYPKSGLKRTQEFDANILGFDVDPDYLDESVVFDQGYDVVGSNTFVAESGVVYSPWPDFDQSYTWRDNSFRESLTGGPDTSKAYGIPLAVTGQPPHYVAGKWPSVVAPLLMRFRCYPRGDFAGWNGFQVQIMVPSSNQPAFRLFSFGGNGGELVVPDIPEAGTKPVGGISTGGGTQKGYGPELYWGQVDFVVKVSRAFTHYFDLGGVLNGVGSLVLEPAAQPENTNVKIEWRGVEEIDLSGCPGPEDLTPLFHAEQFDDYGEFRGSPISRDRLVDPPPVDDFCATISDPSPWTENVAGLAAEEKWKYFQLRITFVSNIEKDLEPTLDAYGFSWTVQ